MRDLEEPIFDSPYGSIWIVAVDAYGYVSILQAPNIHYGFFEGGTTPEDIGLPFEVENTKPGVYRWTCNPWQSTDWESGLVDDFGFEVIYEDLLWTVDSVKIKPLWWAGTNQPQYAKDLITAKQKASEEEKE